MSALSDYQFMEGKTRTKIMQKQNKKKAWMSHWLSDYTLKLEELYGKL